MSELKIDYVRPYLITSREQVDSMFPGWDSIAEVCEEALRDMGGAVVLKIRKLRPTRKAAIRHSFEFTALANAANVHVGWSKSEGAP